jgi:UDP-N-acetylmuramate: L-alanyl-gamma-D-glutamyl-meso-diaminopimelate ligase
MLDAARVAARIRARGPAATSAPDADAALDTLAETVAPGDVVVAMSNGSFGGLPRRLVGRLQRRAEGAKG